ncbi:hypothetical protein ABC977_04065 [Thioalkalicoccus limnaeus]|uniref:Uncharacterized protein n=1 Tax=Thioalkalicoccus limnaeus TaxID=120681 RepID=A0ABV4BAU7_9GAMM
MQICAPQEGQPIDPPDVPPTDEDGLPLPEAPSDDETIVGRPGVD